MKTERQLILALPIGFGSFAVLAVGSSVPYIGMMMGATLLPGALLAALIFPQGIHSNYGWTYLVLSAVLDGLIFSSIALVVLRIRSRNVIR